MVTDSENFIHTDLNGEDDRENIAEVIESGNGYNFGKREGIPAHYWQNYIRYHFQLLLKILYILI
jgi:hypothetical protein